MKTILVDNEIEAMSYFEKTAEKMLNITIDVISVKVPEGYTILQAAE